MVHNARMKGGAAFGGGFNDCYFIKTMNIDTVY